MFADIFVENNEINTKEEKYKPLALCPTCSSDIILKLNEDNKLETFCPNCGNKIYYRIQFYIDAVLEYQPIKQINICKTHNQSFKYYCKECRVHLCSQCELIHKHKQNIEHFPHIDIREYKSNLLKSQSILSNQVDMLKRTYLEPLQKLIKEFDDSLNCCINNNEKISLLLEMIYDTYSEQFPSYINN